MWSWYRGDQLPAGWRWIRELPRTFQSLDQWFYGEPPHIACVVCHKRWRLKYQYEAIKQENFTWLLEHAWSHAQLHTIAAADFYAVPIWERDSAGPQLTAAELAAHITTKEGRQSRSDPSRAAGSTRPGRRAPRGRT